MNPDLILEVVVKIALIRGSSSSGSLTWKFGVSTAALCRVRYLPVGSWEILSYGSWIRSAMEKSKWNETRLGFRMEKFSDLRAWKRFWRVWDLDSSMAEEFMEWERFLRVSEVFFEGGVDPIICGSHN